MEIKRSNRLINEESLYLRQHAYNPIDWYPWSEEAFEVAKKKDCPIFLSIGYSSCHWCHVMEKESFENEEIAKILNENFVAIKVDREELPDVDNFYMTFVQAATGSGGWPLNVFLMPDKTPFFGGTYFPPEPKFGKPSFKSILISVLETYKNRKGELEKLRIEVKNFLEKIFVETTSSQNYDYEKIKDVYQLIVNNYDWNNGGWGKGAKFPMFPILNFLIDYYVAFKDENAKKIVLHNLNKILTGGIYDHIGGGMHRYTVDNQWVIPHYEKMLYDNAQLIEVISKYLIVEHNEFFLTKLYETFWFLQSEMKSTKGGYFTAIDADSEGEEGKFYLWNYYQLIDIIDEKFDKDLFFEYYQFNLIEKDNAQGNLSLRKIPDYNDTILINELGLITQHLNQIRNRRTKPLVDNKILTDLNSLLISALSFAYKATNDEKFYEEAKSIYEFIYHYLIQQEKLFHSFVDGKSKIEGFADDYFFFINALINLYKISFEENYLIQSFEILSSSLDEFYDLDKKVIFQHRLKSDLPLRVRDNKDYSKPSSNSIAISVLLELGRIFENNHLTEIAEILLKKDFEEMIQNPFGGGKFLSDILQMYLPQQELILIEGNINDSFNQFKSFVMKQYFPNQIILLKKKDSPFNFSYLNDKTAIDDKLTLYQCENFSCSKPINNPADLD